MTIDTADTSLLILSLCRSDMSLSILVSCWLLTEIDEIGLHVEIIIKAFHSASVAGLGQAGSR